MKDSTSLTREDFCHSSMAANSSHGDARRWLESVLGKDCIPDYQLTKGGLDKLERLRKKCEEAAHMEARLTVLKENDIVELTAEARRVVSIIERSGKHYMPNMKYLIVRLEPDKPPGVGIA